ncbi:hypothetical protein ACVMDN_007956 [Bradyrhizobium sp. USDA 4510]
MSVVSVADVERANGVLIIFAKDILTPLAADRAKELNIRIERSGSLRSAAPPAASPMPSIPLAPSRSAPAAKPSVSPGSLQLGALSGSLYRRGAPVPPQMRVGGEPNAATNDDRPRAAVIGAGHVGATTALPAC